MMYQQVTEKVVQTYLQEKIGLAGELDRKWREVSESSPSRALRGLSQAEAIVQALEEVDQRYFDKFGELEFLSASREISSRAASAASTAREVLKNSLMSAQDALGLVRLRFQELKEGLGRRLSEIKPRRRLPRHGKFDRRA